MRNALAFASLLLIGCYSPLPLELGDGGVVHDGAVSADLSRNDSHDPVVDLAGAACSTLAEVDCSLRKDCTPNVCNMCSQSTTYFGCRSVGEPAPPCPASCPLICDKLAEDQCNATGACHAVYAGCDGHTNCSADNAKFMRCDSGAPSCKFSDVTCNLAIQCPPGFVAEVADHCYDGCVKQEQCCSPACTGTSSCQPCWIDYSCLPDGAVC